MAALPVPGRPPETAGLQRPDHWQRADRLTATKSGLRTFTQSSPANPPAGRLWPDPIQGTPEQRQGDGQQESGHGQHDPRPAHPAGPQQAGHGTRQVGGTAGPTAAEGGDERRPGHARQGELGQGRAPDPQATPGAGEPVEAERGRHRQHGQAGEQVPRMGVAAMAVIGGDHDVHPYPPAHGQRPGGRRRQVTAGRPVEGAEPAGGANGQAGHGGQGEHPGYGDQDRRDRSSAGISGTRPAGSGVVRVGSRPSRTVPHSRRGRARRAARTAAAPTPARHSA